MTVPLLLFPAENPCTGEPLLLEGELKGRFKMTTSSGGSVTFLTFLDATGVNAVETLGTRSYSGSTSDFIETHVAEGAEQTMIQRASMNGSFPNDNFYIQAVTHFTVTPNGVPTATVDNVNFKCS